MSREINLDEFWNKRYPHGKLPKYAKDIIIEYSKELLELAAENSQNKWITVGRELDGFVDKGEFDNPEDALALANKLNDSQNVFYYDYSKKPVVRSILDTINQIK